jgi:sec-independent protein translocase protein TatB
MLDIGFSELVVIGVVALIVIGPERLPRVARTAGHLLGRFQRYVAEVKADINREIELSELKKLRSTVEDAARSIEQDVKTGVQEAEKEFRDAQTALDGAGTELRQTEEQLKQSIAGITTPHMGTLMPDPQAGSPAQTATPLEGTMPVTADVQAGRAEREDLSPQLELGLDGAVAPAAREQR